ncbi:uncharacterized protein [Notamacropus eugenii]|uniref:uncharacterized protein isoform X2 n=1 Tax=Notamacropus eugenii TaxID=9315 RepID=UPI003B67C608
MDTTNIKPGRRNYEENPSQAVLKENNDKLSTKGKKVHFYKAVKRKKRKMIKKEKRSISLAPTIPVTERLSHLSEQKEAENDSSKPHIAEWTLSPKKKLQDSTDLTILEDEIEQNLVESSFSESVGSITSLYLDHVKDEEYSGDQDIAKVNDGSRVPMDLELAPNKPSEAQASEDDQTEIISLHEEDDVEKKIASPDLSPSQADLITDKEEPLTLSDVIISITSLIKRLDLDKVIDLRKDKKDRSKLSQIDVPQQPLPPRKTFVTLEDGRRVSAPHNLFGPSKKISSSPFHKKATEQVFPVEKKQASSLKNFGIKKQVKMAPPDKENYLRIKHFLPSSKFFAEKESESSYKLQSQQERSFTPGTSPLNRKKEIHPGFTRVVNAWTISPVPRIQDHNSPPGNMFMPQKPRHTTVKKTFK